MLGKTIFNFFFPALHPEEVDLPQVLLHLGRSRQAVPQPCALWHRMGPLLESTQRSGGASHSSPGTSWAFLPFRREKADKNPKRKGACTRAARVGVLGSTPYHCAGTSPCWTLPQLLPGPCTAPALCAQWDGSDPAEHCWDGALGFAAPVGFRGAVGPTGGGQEDSVWPCRSHRWRRWLWLPPPHRGLTHGVKIPS